MPAAWNLLGVDVDGPERAEPTGGGAPRPSGRQRVVVTARVAREGARPRTGDRWQHAGATWIVLLADDVGDERVRLTLLRGSDG